MKFDRLCVRLTHKSAVPAKNTSHSKNLLVRILKTSAFRQFQTCPGWIYPLNVTRFCSQRYCKNQFVLFFVLFCGAFSVSKGLCVGNYFIESWLFWKKQYSEKKPMFFFCQNLQLRADILAFFCSGLLAWQVERMPLPKKKVRARSNVGAMMSKLKEDRERHALEHQKVLTLSRD